MPSAASVFALPDRLAAKRDERLIARDEEQFGAIAATLDAEAAGLRVALDERRRSDAGSLSQASDRDREIHRLSNRLRTLERFGPDLCLGRMVPADGGAGAGGAGSDGPAADRPAADGTTPGEPVYIGRLGLTGPTGERLLVDWRSAPAAPFFAATHADPAGIVSRRRYRWTDRRVTDYWDEVFTADGADGSASLDDQSAFIASLGAARSETMRDVLGTIQADQDAIIRAGADGTLVVDGGPGTGKTVVALHRAAYLLYSDPRVARHHGGVLFVGPNRAYLDFVADVLPNLGEDGVRMATLRDLDPLGADAPVGAEVPVEQDERVAALKGDGRTSTMLERAVRRHEQPPTRAIVVETAWADVVLTPEDWADAFDAPEPGTPHDDARRTVWDALLEAVAVRARVAPDERAELRADLGRAEAFRAVFDAAWPMLDPEGVVADLWTSDELLAHCAPWLDPGERALLRRDDPRAWTTADLPLLDLARSRIGDPAAGARERDRARAAARDRAEMDRVVDELIASQDRDELMLMTMLRGEDVRNALVDDAALPADPVDPLAGPFAHVVVDEAQELTDAEWAMLVRRCPSRSVTVVGDRAQARNGFAESWADRLARVGLRDARIAPLHVNYRTPSEVMAAAEPVIRAAIPDANVPTSARSGGRTAVQRRPLADLDAVLAEWCASRPDGVAAVVAADPAAIALPPDDRVRATTPAAAKGLEFDLVVIVDPDGYGDGVRGAVDRYVAMTRATDRLVILG